MGRVIFFLLIGALTAETVRAEDGSKRPSSKDFVDPYKATPINEQLTDVVPGDARGKPVRFAMPGAAQRKEALDALKEIFKDDFTRKAANDKTALAEKLIEQARKVQEDKAGQYVLIEQAAILAAQAGDFVNFLEYRDTLFENFEVSEKVLSELTKNAMTQAVAALKDPAVVKVANALKSLSDKPDDPAANLAAGSWLALAKESWEHGLPHLAKCSRPGLKALAQKDLALAGDEAKKTPAAEIEMGDDWWNYAEKADKDEKHSAQARAARWYNLALPSQTGLTKVKLEKRTAGFPIAKSTTPETPLTSAQLEKHVSLPYATYAIQNAATIAEDATVIFNKATVLQNGRIDISKGSKAFFFGSSRWPIVVRNVEFVCSEQSILAAHFTFFENCTFKRAGEIHSRMESKLYSYDSLFFKCRMKEYVGYDRRMDFQDSAFASTELPPITLAEFDGNIGDVKLNQPTHVTMVGGCSFLDCKIEPLWFWCTEHCNFSECRFATATQPIPSVKAINITAFVSTCEGKPFTESAKSPVTFTPSKTSFPGPQLPATTVAAYQPVIKKLAALSGQYQWISREAVYTASSVYNKDFPSPALLTGAVHSYYTHNFHTNSELGDIIIDLGAMQPVSAVEIHNRRMPELLYRSASLALWTSDNSEGPWQKQWQAAEGLSEYGILLEQPAECRFVKIGLTRKECLHLDQVRIFEKTK